MECHECGTFLYDELIEDCENIYCLECVEWNRLERMTPMENRWLEDLEPSIIHPGKE